MSHHHSASSLEELEARCEVLSRRVVERPPVRSPSRTQREAHGSVVSHHESTVPALSAQDMATAVASLEREKYRLEEQLRLVNMHLAAYNLLRANSSSAFAEGGAPTVPVTPAPRGNATLHAPPDSHTQDVYRAQERQVSPLPLSSPQVAPTTGSKTPGSQTEHIYEELRQIRKAREERESARHAQLQAQSGVSGTSYRLSTGQRY